MAAVCCRIYSSKSPSLGWVCMILLRDADSSRITLSRAAAELWLSAARRAFLQELGVPAALLPQKNTKCLIPVKSSESFFTVQAHQQAESAPQIIRDRNA